MSAKFKYGGNVDEPHRRAVVERLQERGGPGDDAAAAMRAATAGRVEPALIPGSASRLAILDAASYSTAAARLASVAAISFSACAALWSPATRARMANHRLRWSTHDSVTRQPASVSSNS